MIAFLLCMNIGCMIVIGWLLYARKRSADFDRELMDEKPVMEISLLDIIRLSDVSGLADVNLLILEHNLENKMPEFYSKYQELIKKNREIYFMELVNILGKKRKEFINDLFDRYHGFSTQDVLLLLMCEMGLDNKTMARVMTSSLDTLKKRKTRLRAKMRASGLELNGAAGE